ncbi:MAG: efflux RND transporter periplasmic adaptor subunit [Rhodospirillales bacterium]|nr:efflux RND transporter periplasmic adaptor subunit [Rhodospirillales bacterium]
MKRSYVIAGGIVAAVGLWLATGLIGDDGDPAPTERATADAAAASESLPSVQVRTLDAASHDRRLNLFGRTEAGRAVEVRAETGGRLVELVAEKGRWVDEGDVIVRLAMEDRQSRLREAEAAVQQWQQKFEATQQLSKSGFQSEVRKAEDWAALEAAEARLAATRLDIERIEVRAPFRGVVDALPVEVGDVVEVHDPVATVVDLDPIEVVVAVPERMVGGVSVGSQADIRLVTGRQLTGAVRYLARMGSSETRTFRVEIVVDNPDGAIPEGLTAEVSLPLGPIAAHLVSPAVLTLNDAGELGVKTIDGDGEVAFRPVQIIDDTTNGMWVGGLPERVTVITVGQEFVRDGQRVRPVEEAGANSAAVAGDTS